MEPLFAIGPGLLAWPASPLWFARPGKPERFMTWATKITERFTSGHRANSEGYAYMVKRAQIKRPGTDGRWASSLRRQGWGGAFWGLDTLHRPARSCSGMTNTCDLRTPRVRQ